MNIQKIGCEITGTPEAWERLASIVPDRPKDRLQEQAIAVIRAFADQLDRKDQRRVALLLTHSQYLAVIPTLGTDPECSQRMEWAAIYGVVV